jgi:endonuclease YncB( thermonuclease family)
MKRRDFLSGVFGLGVLGADPAPAIGAIALSGDRFRLGLDECRLADLLAPEDGDAFAREAAAGLAELLKDAALDVADARIGDLLSRDRWGRRIVVAQILREGAPRALEEEVVASGLARVRPESDDHDAIRRLLDLESAARKARSGLWALGPYVVRDGENAASAIGAFQLVEGVVVSGDIAKGRAFLNFGADYRTDFTVTAGSRAARRWAKEGLDFTRMAGARVRARGFVSRINGPSIEARHPLQIEIL